MAVWEGCQTAERRKQNYIYILFFSRKMVERSRSIWPKFLFLRRKFPFRLFFFLVFHCWLLPTLFRNLVQLFPSRVPCFPSSPLSSPNSHLSLLKSSHFGRTLPPLCPRRLLAGYHTSDLLSRLHRSTRLLTLLIHNLCLDRKQRDVPMNNNRNWE